MSASITLKRWVKRRETPAARTVHALIQSVRGARMPVVRPVHRTLYGLHLGVRHVCAEVVRILWWTPLFVSRLETPAPGLRLYGGMPQVLGPLHIRLGRDCRMSGQTTLIGRTDTPEPTLVVGNNVDIGWQTTISVGTRVELGDNVRLAGRCMLAGFPGHPLDAAARAAGAPDTTAQIGDIVLERDVWLATGVMVVAGVRIGRGTVVAAGSVVTRDLPPLVLAAGAPARVVRSLADSA
jgi:acetyltransferase-like isoleucine patch superfamily enzyme